MKILMLSSNFPYPAGKGQTQMRTFNFLKYLQHHHKISLVTQRSQDITDTEVEQLKQWVEELVIFPRPAESRIEAGLLGKAKRFGTFVQQGIPPNVLSAYSPAMQEWIDKAIASEEFEALVCEHSVNEIYVRPEWSEQLRTTIDIHSSVYGSCKRQLETHTSEYDLGDQINLPLLRRYEQQYCSKFSAIVTATHEDRRQLKTLNPDAKITVIPNGVDLTLFPRRTANRGGHRLMAIGEMDRADNIDAISFFSREVFPEIRKRYPETTLDLVSDRLATEVSELAKIPGITLTDKVSSLVDYFHWATICVLPIRTGFGLKSQILQAMAAGIPVVASDRALEDLTVDGTSVPLRAMRANQVEEYVYAIGRLFEEPKLREKLSENGRAMVEKEYTWEVMGKRFENIVTGN